LLVNQPAANSSPFFPSSICGGIVLFFCLNCPDERSEKQYEKR
jgi:hypothetical protein